MNSQAFAMLEFDQLRQLVQRHAQTEIGRAHSHALEPFEEIESLQGALRQVAEAMQLRSRAVRFSFEGVADPSQAIARLKIEGAALEPLTILDLVRLCNAALDARSAILAERGSCPALFKIVAALSADLQKLTKAITKKILPNGELDDRASPELARIRHDVGRLRSSITRSLENLMHRSSEAIQEELVTVRNDRFVIPVRADHRGRINGVAHGSSSSGATIFVEPLQTIEANNELQTLREAEQREIAEILFRLSEDLRAELPQIEAAAEAVAALDVINAKAAFAAAFDCVVPEVAESNSLELVEARHPLLEQNLRQTDGCIVPVSFALDDESTTMVISGANAGGKTVVLKTAGLLSLMALAGLPVPARAARVPFYRSILADIGDHQSLAANLSTFTSHVANIASMIETCETPALVLLDEVGTGTDPEEGSALGVAVVDHFKQRAAHVLATTHYSGLKMYAANQPGVLNASVEFDEKTLRPTYRLLVGLAGSSSGLEIAQRFGIPVEIISKANEQVKQSSREAIEYLRRIKRESEEAESLRCALEEERAAVAEKFAKLDRDFQKRERERQAQFDKQLSAVVGEFEKLSRELVAKIQERADRVKVEREAQKQAAELKREAQRATQAAKSKPVAPTPTNVPSQLRGVRVVRDGEVVNAGREVSGSPESAEASTNPIAARSIHADGAHERKIRVGDRVQLSSFGSIGIVDQIRGDEAEVRVGSLRMREKISNLELVEPTQEHETARGAKPGSSPTRGPQTGSPAGVGAVREGSLEKLRRQTQTTELHLHSKEPDSNFKTSDEINLIGKTTDEAVDLTDKFLDEAFLNGLNEVRIIHGHGTGALRKAITEFLSDHPHVERFASAPQDKGGAGATQVELKS